VAAALSNSPGDNILCHLCEFIVLFSEDMLLKPVLIDFDETIK